MNKKNNLYIKKSLALSNNKNLIVEVGQIAKKASSSLIVEVDGTVLLIAIVYSENNEADFLPLKVEYFERFYASGRIPCNYFKREGKPSERETLIARLVDRSIRPMFPKNFSYELQVTITVMSINPEINPDIIAINGTSLALALSGLPFKLISATRITYKNNNIIINPTTSELKSSNVDLVIAGDDKNISMLDGSFNEINKEQLIDIIIASKPELIKITNFISNIKTEHKIKNIKYTDKFDTEFYLSINEKYFNEFSNLHKKHNYNDENIVKFKINLINKYLKDAENPNIKKNMLLFLNLMERKILRKKIIDEKKRLDKRLFTDIREIKINYNFLKRIHGSSVFTRGDTQAIANITLGSYKDAQLIDCVFFSHYKNNFILHYNFPPYAVNEIGNINITKRREIGHGNLARKALLAVIPPYDEYPFVIRIVSEITSSNGSSSMATVCASSLVLNNAGVPIKRYVAGIAMGLIKNNDQYFILSDISGEEDFIGDMDLKLAGTINGFTALQMDIKMDGLSMDIMDKILDQGFAGIKKILEIMNNNTISGNKINKSVPKVKTIKISKNKIKDLIGKNGVTIKGLTEKFKCDIDVNNDGLVRVSSISLPNIDVVVNEIKNLTKEIKIGMNFEGKVIKLAQFGAFINLFHKKDGLLHISKINKYKLNNPNWEIEEGSKLNVTIAKIDHEGKISLNLN